ncbi:MAG: hypothetical protein GTN89_02355 [Acidobacteria bacterium]|nr:hypothetical protein [Acidobacteriota bacterium]NIM61801.1 hypothetical protein [Acidobacteriota bacterium]NIO58212.1 hypothetical protein [Acidobacteriota bacterium]NIQ29229.1 hypothetical protein [Acidobacteriota bacterium]NIQ83806.1 hypothetical protein [Acidobacteriota bacterium]
MARLAVIVVALAIPTAPAFADEPLDRMRESLPAWMNERDDPGQDGWASEVFSNAAGKQLKRLAHRIETGEEVDLATLAHPRFEASARVGPLELVFERGPLTVRRRKPLELEAVEDPASGAERFEQLLARLFEPLKDRPQKRVKFKVVEVTPSESTEAGKVTTRVLCEGVGSGSSGSVQLTAALSVDWLPGSGMPLMASISIEDYEQVELGEKRTTMFSDWTESVLGEEPAFRDQLMFGNEYWMRRMQTVLGIDNYGHHGLAVGDVNGDGLEDLYVCQTGGMPNLLFIQNEDGSAREAGAEAGVDFMDRTHAALLLDLDNDRDQDLVLSTQTSLLFLENDGTGSFRLAAEGGMSAYSLAAADYDGDGDLDIYATAYVAPPEWERYGGLGLQPLPYHDANNGAANGLWRNDRDWTFRDVTREVGLDVNNRRWSFAAAWADYDDDGDQDLYVANDFGRNNLYRNEGRRFVDVAAAAGVEDSASGMSASWGDYDGDGLLDLYVANMFSSAGNRIVPQPGFKPGTAAVVKSDYRRFARGNTLFRNAGDGTFRDVSESAGVTMGRWAWCSPFVDVNNDGHEDLVVANGYLTNEGSGDL